jgi:hypothetical protein
MLRGPACTRLFLVDLALGLDTFERIREHGLQSAVHRRDLKTARAPFVQGYHPVSFLSDMISAEMHRHIDTDASDVHKRRTQASENGRRVE